MQNAKKKKSEGSVIIKKKKIKKNKYGLLYIKSFIYKYSIVKILIILLQLAVVYIFSLMQYYFYYTNVTPKTELICFSIIALYSCFYNLFINLSTILKIKMDLIPVPVIFYYLSILLIFLKRNTKYKFLKHPLLKDSYILYYILFFGIIYLLDYAHTIITNICKELNITFIFNKKYKKK
ncbi:hypothetical protein PFDG_03227 [Plasmodium falciparum Dd2]|uniref:Uncharacterized protein n=1 Tax=Plasmodium falciparum (isolate Dd2) TaxID=57267 RepID=A0A0L7M2M6_PLAF4|nr:hypothetical protein PFDG_03227 [Plasmodium falciparum Dd2]